MSLNKIYKDKMGRYRTYSLFVETNHNTVENPVYTLRDEDYEKDGVIYPSAKKIFMECEDITGYKAALALVGCWEAWERLQDNKVLNKCIAQWTKELGIKLKSKAIKALIDVALNEGVKGQGAAKYLAEQGWVIDRKNRKPGRPPKKVKDVESQGLAKEIEDDLYLLKNLEDLDNKKEDTNNG